MRSTRDAGRPILIVDDEEGIRVVLSATLARLGYPTVQAPHGLDGLAAARLHQPAVILLDLVMPQMDGAAFRRAQRADPAIADIPVICMSASCNGPMLAELLGAQRFLPKPFSVQALTAAVAAVLGESDAATDPGTFVPSSSGTESPANQHGCSLVSVGVIHPYSSQLD